MQYLERLEAFLKSAGRKAVRVRVPSPALAIHWAFALQAAAECDRIVSADINLASIEHD